VKLKLMFCALSFSLAATVARATPMITVGTPGDSLLSSPSKPSPAFGTLYNFDSLTPFSSYSTYTTGSFSISSPDGLEVLPYSTQSGPNELYDNSVDGSASITLTFTNGEYKVGIGIADSDPVSVTFQPLGSNGLALGSSFTENLLTTESLVNTGNGYYVFTDSGSDIYGLKITESVGNANYSGLAIDDLQIAATPEPASIGFLAEGICALGAFASLRRFKRA
jgi:hypothetical protein